MGFILRAAASAQLLDKDNVTEDVNENREKIDALKLKHIHGYRGFDCRDNLFYVDDGKKIVYCAAGAGVVMNLADKKQEFYLEHTDDIISLAVNPNSKKIKNVVATGQNGENPTIHVWDAITKNTLSILSDFHQKGICSLDFSGSGRFLVSVGLDSYFTIAVWKWSEGTLLASHRGDDLEHRIFKAAFRPDSDTQFVSVGFKHIRFWSVAGSQLINKKGVMDEIGSNVKTKMPTLLSIGFAPVRIKN